jgi:uncharacterized cofD-like protein
VRRRALRRVVALGGGTGLPAVLAGLRRHLPSKCRITAIVTAVDDGGSSGILRREYGVLPPGDIRSCLVALARVAPEITAALQCRLTMSSSTAEHSVGNLLLMALDLVAADEVAAIRLASRLLGIDDVILPSTTTRAELVARLADGRQIRGESAIPQSGAAVIRVAIDPADAVAAPGVLVSLQEADAIIIGPGSLYTSILATLAVPGIADAVVRSQALKILVGNLMTEPGETLGYGVAAHVAALAAHGVPPDALDYVVLSSGPVHPDRFARYAAQGAAPVVADFAGVRGRPRIVTADLFERGPVIRHDPHKLGPLLCALGARRRTASRRPRRQPSLPGCAVASATNPVPLTA